MRDIRIRLILTVVGQQISSVCHKEKPSYQHAHYTVYSDNTVD